MLSLDDSKKHLVKKAKTTHPWLQPIQKNYPLMVFKVLFIQIHIATKLNQPQLSRSPYYSPLYLLHISLKRTYENLVLDQDNFYLISLNILITCLLDNVWILLGEVTC